MAITQSAFGTLGDREVYAYTLDNGRGLRAEILNYGGILRRLIYKGVDVVLGYNTFAEYPGNPTYFGALVGRNANRIADAVFTLNGQTYTLCQNDGKNNLHGGEVGFDKKIWDVTVADGVEPSLLLSLVSPDGEEGFPGTVTVQVTYTLTADNSLKIHYTGEADRDTVLNLTNHAYFNLNGHGSGAVSGHTLFMESDFYTPNSDDCIPTGEVHRTSGTPFDFSSPARLEERLFADFPQVRKFRGFDHNFILNGRGYRKVARFTGDKTGIAMDIYTDRVGMQVYSGNMITEGLAGKDGEVYGPYSGVCFETQMFPNAPRFSHFPDTLLKKGEKYDTVTAYQFI